jgi:predicted N-acetyltransferase YhbS
MSEQITLREASSEDTEELSRILFEAFGAIHDHHRFPRDFPSIEAATGMLSPWIPHPSVWGVVAEADGRIVGSNFLDERDEIFGVGPITVDPGAQNSGVGRKLMEAVLERGAGAPGIRLVQDGFHMRSLSLYTSLGFDVTAACVVMSGMPDGRPESVEVRRLVEGDLEQCAALSERVHGITRTGALRDALQAFSPHVALRDGRVVAYATTLDFWPMAHGVAETPDDLKGLLLGTVASTGEPLALLVPLRSELFPWCLAQGLRALKPMNVMALGSYQEPNGAWFPSVIY